MRRVAAAVLGLAALGVSPAIADGSESRSETPAAWPPHYGNAPEELVPYRRAAPFQRFFTEPQPFLGPGRDEPAPRRMKSLKIGLMAPAPSSYDAGRGAMMRRGVELAFEEANASRRDVELPFELVVREDAPLWGSAANIMVDFAYKDAVLAVIGAVDSTATHVALRVSLKAELFLVNTASNDPTVTETNIPWILRTWPDDRQHGYRLAELVVKERGCRRIVVLRANDRYGRMGITIFNSSVRRLGFPVAQEMRFLPGDRSFDTQVARIRAVDPDAVVFWGEAADVGQAAAALRKVGIKAPFFGPDRLLDRAYLEAAGDAAEGTTVTAPLDPNRTDEVWKEFHRRFEKRWGTAPDAFAAYAYDGARILIDAVRRAGANRFVIRDAMTSVKRYDGVAGTMLFDPTANNVAPIQVMRVVRGAFVSDGRRIASVR
jgi:ABC-type branched-subunit amino acid transport system substrate-binding protein